MPRVHWARVASTQAGTVTIPADRSLPGEEPPGAVNWGPPRGRHAALRAGRRALVLAHSSTASRRFIPMGAMLHLINAFASFSERRKNGLWQQNVTFYGDLLRHTPLAGSEERVAAEAMREFMVCVELFWRPWLMCRGSVEKRQMLRAAQREGRGVVGVFPHFGPSYAQFPSLLGYGIDAWVVASPHHYEAPAGDSYDVRFARQGARYLDMLGPGHVVQRAGDASVSAFGEMRDMLRSGKTVLIAFDIIGNMPTPFLGRRLRLTNGPARLAQEADALVVPIINRRQGTRPVVRFGETLDPRNFDDAESLQRAIAGQMEQWALEAPEAVWPLHTQPGGSPLIRGDVIQPATARAR
jgi:lauroyl/myristoyl acyltransferase